MLRSSLGHKDIEWLPRRGEWAAVYHDRSTDDIAEHGNPLLDYGQDQCLPLSWALYAVGGSDDARCGEIDRGNEFLSQHETIVVAESAGTRHEHLGHRASSVTVQRIAV